MDMHELDLLATTEVENDENFYKIVDFLNRTLKVYDLAFGLSKEADGSRWLSVYESTEHKQNKE